MKNLTTLVLAGLVTLALVGCDQDRNRQPSVRKDTTTTTTTQPGETTTSTGTTPTNE